MSATWPKIIAPKAAASSAVEVTRPTAQGDGCHSSFRMDMTTPMMKRSYASVKKPMPEMNMTFQCCFVILESSIRERMSVSLNVASDIVCKSLSDASLRASFFQRADWMLGSHVTEVSQNLLGTFRQIVSSIEWASLDLARCAKR